MTNDKKTIKSLEKAVAEADALAAQKSNFLATMSHEIRTPMQTIYGLLELIADEKPDENIAQMTATAQQAASGLLEILDDILDVAKMDADKMELDMFEVPVRTLVRGMLEGLAVKVHGLKVDLIDDIAEDVPFVIIGDPKRLRQILMNLCGNGIKFTKQGSVTVRVTTDVQSIAVPKNGIGLRFEIVDTGIGMSKAVCEKLFGSFVQADTSTQREFGGTGLGLNISKKLITLMDGEVGVTSIEGEGSTFWFEIPTQEVSTDTTTLDLPELDGISVLSVEDHPQGAKEIVRTLRSMGATVESCATYADAINAVKQQPFDVGVIDQGLPDGLGLDLIKEIMQTRPNMGLVMYTVRDDVGLSHSLQALGVKYLTKPASRAGLGEAVRDAATQTEALSVDGPRRLLVAEDTEGVREVLSRQLAKLNIDYDFAFNGAEALEKYRTGAYGLVITDLHMPEMDGYGLVKAVRDDNPDFPVIVLTADVQMAQREAYAQHGFNECLLKPVSLGQFRQLLVRWGLYNAEIDGDEGRASLAPGQDTHVTGAIDRSAMKDIMGDFGENEIAMLKMFPDMVRGIVDCVNETAASDNYKALAEAAHSLKGAARSACAMTLGDIAGKVQDDAENNQCDLENIKAINDAFSDVENEITSL